MDSHSDQPDSETPISSGMMEKMLERLKQIFDGHTLDQKQKAMNHLTERIREDDGTQESDKENRSTERD
jgi:hypothetical protein